MIFRMYVSALLPLNLDNHNRIPTSYLRLLRRIVRDYETRGASVSHTPGHVGFCAPGEERWIFPYQEHADVIFNSSLLYELAVLKKHIFPLLNAVTWEDPCYEEVRSIVKVLITCWRPIPKRKSPPPACSGSSSAGTAFTGKGKVTGPSHLQKRQLEIRLEMGISPISGRKLFSLFQASCSGGRNLQLARDAWGWNFSDVKKFEKNFAARQN